MQSFGLLQASLSSRSRCWLVRRRTITLESGFYRKVEPERKMTDVDTTVSYSGSF